MFFSVDFRSFVSRERAVFLRIVCLFVSYLFRVGHSTDMCSLLQENLLLSDGVSGLTLLCEVTRHRLVKSDKISQKSFEDHGPVVCPANAFGSRLRGD